MMEGSQGRSRLPNLYHWITNLGKVLIRGKEAGVMREEVKGLKERNREGRQRMEGRGERGV